MIKIRFWFKDQESHLRDKQSSKKMTEKTDRENMNWILWNSQQKKEKAIKANVTNSLKTDENSIYRFKKSLKTDKIDKKQRSRKSDFHFSSTTFWWNFSFKIQQ